MRLDRALVTPNWLEYFPNVRVQHLEDTTSNHCTLLLADSNTLQRCRKHKFFLEAIWARRVDCKKLIKEVWNASTNLHDPSGFSAGLKKCVDSLAKLGKSAFGQILRKIKKKKAILSELTKNDTEGKMGLKLTS